jgi:uroporphyrinogen decarboxylase
MSDEMTSMERVLTALSFKEPDRVPLLHLLTVYGAKESHVSIKEYFSKPELVAHTQLSMQQKYGHDCLYPFYYASLELEAWGSESIFFNNAPPNSGRPIIDEFDDILSLKAPDVLESSGMGMVLETTKVLKEHAGEDIPIIGVVMSPFSLPVMQMGFSNYLDLIYGEPDIFLELMQINEKFSVEWANLQVEAGATAICYFDPVSSSTIIPPELYRKTGFKVAKKSISQIKAPVATHMASGRCLPIIDDIAETGSAVICTSVLEDLGEVKSACAGRMSVLGNLNGIEMIRWTQQDSEAKVKDAIEKAAKGGGYIMSDNHGEIPYQVPEDIIMNISNSVRKWGTYPLRFK